MKRPHASARRYSDRTLKVLWGRSAGRCAVPECRSELFVDDSEYDPLVIIGDIAHVEAASDTGPRANQVKGIGSRDVYDNLILLCKNCHARIDGQKRKFTIDAIWKLKAEHEAWVRAQLPERGLSRTAWTVVFLQGGHPIDAQHAISALRPDYPESNPCVIEILADREDWQQTSTRIASSVHALFERSDPFNKRFAVFPLAPISACAALGYRLTDRPRVKLFQYHRHSQSWDWDVARSGGCEDSVVGLPSKPNRRRGDLVICFELSASIEKTHLQGAWRRLIGTVRFQIQRPSTSWLGSASQVDTLGEKTHDFFENVLRQYPNATCWHLFIASPAPAAVRIGQAMNPSMTPPVQLYEFKRSTTPTYIPSIRLGGQGK